MSTCEKGLKGSVRAREEVHTLHQYWCNPTWKFSRARLVSLPLLSSLLRHIPHQIPPSVHTLIFSTIVSSDTGQCQVSRQKTQRIFSHIFHSSRVSRILRVNMSSRGGRQSMSELRYRRLLEHNQRLREDLARPRVRVSEASARSVMTLSPDTLSSPIRIYSLIRHCKTTEDHLVRTTLIFSLRLDSRSPHVRFHPYGAQSRKPKTLMHHQAPVGPTAVAYNNFS